MADCSSKTTAPQPAEWLSESSSPPKLPKRSSTSGAAAGAPGSPTLPRAYAELRNLRQRCTDEREQRARTQEDLAELKKRYDDLKVSKAQLADRLHVAEERIANSPSKKKPPPAVNGEAADLDGKKSSAALSAATSAAAAAPVVPGCGDAGTSTKGPAVEEDGTTVWQKYLEEEDGEREALRSRCEEEREAAEV